MVRILHITRDYPDEIDPEKTSSIRDLVKNTREFQHCIFSLNKTTQHGKQRIAKNEGDVYSVVYLGMPYGLLMQHFLTRVAKLLYELIVEIMKLLSFQNRTGREVGQLADKSHFRSGKPGEWKIYGYFRISQG